jgi:energy-coupling factor transport system substrate-specific component
MTAATVSRSANRIPLTLVVALVPAAAALNIVGSMINNALKLPIFLDMIGTAVAAIVLGPWWGALTRSRTSS